MAPTPVGDCGDGQGCPSSQSLKEKNSQKDYDDEQGRYSSQSREDESSQDESSQYGYDSDYGDSDCSITSGLNFCHPAPYVDPQPTDLTVLEADESANTTWTDEKHSSYLDSMEATFVQKMYSKEYCSLDVCGHLSPSSVSLEQECVESQPVCLNMRKPNEQRLAGLLTFRASSRPVSLVPSMWASPWIQHFKSQKKKFPVKIASSRSSESQDEAASTKEVAKETSVTNIESRLNERSPQSSHDSAPRKRGALISFSDCKYAATNSSGYTRTSVSKIAGDYKKYRSQLSTLSDMDILMEEQYNSEQQINLGTDIRIEDGKEESKKCLASHCEHNDVSKFTDKVVSEEIRAIKQDLGGTPLQKLDQVVPSVKVAEGEEACGKRISLDPDGGGDEAVLCTNLSAAGNFSSQSYSQTRAWGIEGPRYHLIGKKAAQTSQT